VDLVVLLISKHAGIGSDNLSSRGVKIGLNTLLGHKDPRILGDSLSPRGVKWVQERCLDPDTPSLSVLEVRNESRCIVDTQTC
jgi:hypothetical protein